MPATAAVVAVSMAQQGLSSNSLATVAQGVAPRAAAITRLDFSGHAGGALAMQNLGAVLLAFTALRSLDVALSTDMFVCSSLNDEPDLDATPLCSALQRISRLSRLQLDGLQAQPGEFAAAVAAHTQLRHLGMPRGTEAHQLSLPAQCPLSSAVLCQVTRLSAPDQAALPLLEPERMTKLEALQLGALGQELYALPLAALTGLRALKWAPMSFGCPSGIDLNAPGAFGLPGIAQLQLTQLDLTPPRDHTRRMHFLHNIVEPLCACISQLTSLRDLRIARISFHNGGGFEHARRAAAALAAAWSGLPALRTLHAVGVTATPVWRPPQPTDGQSASQWRARAELRVRGMQCVRVELQDLGWPHGHLRIPAASLQGWLAQLTALRALEVRLQPDAAEDHFDAYHLVGLDLGVLPACLTELVLHGIDFGRDSYNGRLPEVAVLKLSSCKLTRVRIGASFDDCAADVVHIEHCTWDDQEQSAGAHPQAETQPSRQMQFARDVLSLCGCACALHFVSARAGAQAHLAEALKYMGSRASSLVSVSLRCPAPGGQEAGWAAALAQANAAWCGLRHVEWSAQVWA